MTNFYENSNSLLIKVTTQSQNYVDTLLDLISDNKLIHLKIVSQFNMINDYAKLIFDTLNGYDKLLSLDISEYYCDNSIVVDLIVKVIRNNTNLKSLKLGKLANDFDVVKVYDAIVNLNSLEILDLAECSSFDSNVNHNIVDVISNNLYLKEIRLMDIRSRDGMIEVLNAISKSTYFESITIDNCCLDHEFVPWIIDIIKSNSDLKKLNINKISLGDSLLEIGKEIVHNGSIEYLVIGRCNSSLEICDQFLEIIQENYTLTYIKIDPIDPNDDDHFGINHYLDMYLVDDEIDFPHHSITNFINSVRVFISRNKKFMSKRRFLSTKVVYGSF